QPGGGKGRVAQEPGAFLAKGENLDNGGVVVVGVAVVATGDEGLVELLAQVAAGRGLEKRLHERARQRYDGPAGTPALSPPRAPRPFCSRDKTTREPLAIGLGKLHEPLLLVAEQVVAKGGPKMGQPLVDLGHPRLRSVIETRASPGKARIGALQQPQLLTREA